MAEIRNPAINNRVKQLRLYLDLKQGDFASKIGIKQSSLSSIENVAVNVSDRVIKDICLSFNVSEEWLRAGCGEMFQDTNKTILSQLAQEYGMDDLEVDILDSYLSLDFSDRQGVKKMLQTFVERRLRKAGFLEHAAVKAVDPVPETVDDEIEKELQRYRAELEAEKNAKTRVPFKNINVGKLA